MASEPSKQQPTIVSCPHEDTISALRSDIDTKHRETQKFLARQDAQNQRILDLLQGEDPLMRPGEGLVSKVNELYGEKKERDDAVRRVKKLAWIGASSGAGAAGLALWEWFKSHWR